MESNKQLTVITAESDYQMIRILRLLEKVYPHLRWAGCGVLPSNDDIIEELRGRKLSFLINIEENLLAYSCNFEIDNITMAELEEQACKLDSEAIAENPQIHITIKGRKTIAVYKQNGEVYAKGEAACAPEDDFDFFKGANLALERLMKEKKSNDAFLKTAIDIISGLGEKIRMAIYNIGVTITKQFAPESETEEKGGKNENE